MKKRWLRAAIASMVLLLGFVLLGATPAKADETAEQAASNSTLALNWLYVESPELDAPATQNIAISLGEGDEDISDVVLTYVDDDGESHNLAYSQHEEQIYLFSESFTNTSPHSYTLETVSYELGGAEFSIDLEQLGMNATWYLNAAEMSGITTYSLDDATDESVVTLDETDDTSDIEQAVQNAVEENVADALSAKARSRAASGSDAFVVVLDPGHGGSDVGATSSNGKLKESKLNLKIAQYCKAELEKYDGVKVYLTRSGDDYIAIAERVEFAQEKGADVFVSIHLNSDGGSGTAKGAEVYYPNANYNVNGSYEEGKELAEQILKQLTSLGLKDRGIKVRNTVVDEYEDGTKQDYYGVIRRSKLAGFPGIIVEHAFITNSSDANTYLSSESGLKKLGVADATGIAKAFGLSKNTWHAPMLKTPTAGAKGATVSWYPISGATGYAVYRKTGTGDWSMVATTTSTNYVDTADLSDGTTYYYTVRAYKESESDALAHKYSSTYWTSFSSSGVAVVGSSIPQLTSTVTASSGIKVSWGAVGGASGYAVYRKTGSGGWSMIATTTSTSYTDKKSLKGGTAYSYTVRAYYGSASKAKLNKYDAAYWSGYDGTGIATIYLAAPTLSTESASSAGRKITWKAVTGADGYAVYRKKSGDSWSMIGTTTSVSYTDGASLDAGATYYYTVRAYAGDATVALAHRYSSTYWSHYNGTGLKTTYLATPTLTSTTAASSGIKVSWGAVGGASGYAVYRKTGSGGWSMIATTTTSTSYTDKKSLKGGTAYAYTVRAYKGSTTTAKAHKYSSAYWSGYDNTGIQASYLPKPTLKSESASAQGTKISWGSVSGANGYAVYRKPAGGSWSMIATTTSTSYVDAADLTDGATYYYTVRAFKSDSETALSNKYDSAFWSYFDSTGLKTVHLDIPVLNYAVHDGNNVVAAWNSVPGANGYAVYRKTDNGGWSMIATTTSTAYSDAGAAAKSDHYRYIVRAYKGSASTAKKHKYSSCYWSGYDDDGMTVQ